ncbi:MAG: CBS domain-containing protein [Brumimicrobium sp.]|nr:CBS domain-containing protein [Brumimicrobium sp.]
MGSANVEFINDSRQQRDTFHHIMRDLDYLRSMIEDGKLNRNTFRIGAEQEMCFLDSALRPAPVIEEFLKRIDDDQFVPELAAFNLEMNLKPLVFTGNCFSEMEARLNKLIAKGEKTATDMDGLKLIMTGITPTIGKMDMELENLTPTVRSQAMIKAMDWLRQKNPPIRITGKDDLFTTDFSNMFQSCNTSFQIHYQVNPDEFIDRYNFAQAIAAPVLAACTNSPTLFGKRLWYETRIALFEQAVDTRESTAHLSEEHMRVPFGTKWAEGSVLNVYEEDLAKFKIFMRHTDPDISKRCFEQGEAPGLVNLNIFNGTIFRWTRACYGVLDGKPHLRIENRLLPAGPTVVDEIANAAFWLGLMHGMPEEYRNLASKMDFDDAKLNLLKAARYGLDSQFRWLSGKKYTAEKLILDVLLPIAEKGLLKAGVDIKDIEKYLDILRSRVKTGKTGSQWVYDSWAQLKGRHSDNYITTFIASAMIKRQREGEPVHTWKLPDKADFEYSKFATVDQFMTTSLYTAKEDDMLDQTVYRMLKNNLNHLPVADREGNLKGLLTKTNMLEKDLLDANDSEKKMLSVKDTMERNPATVSPSTSVQEAIALMQKEGIKCLPVVHREKLTGIITEFDMMHVAEHLLNILKSN